MSKVQKHDAGIFPQEDRVHNTYEDANLVLKPIKVEEIRL